MLKWLRERTGRSASTKAHQALDMSGSLNMMLSPFSRHPPVFGTKELLEAYSRMPWLRAVTGKVGQAVGTTQWKLLVVRDDNGRVSRRMKIQRAQNKDIRERHLKRIDSTNLEEVEDHPMIELLLGGNDRMSGQNVFATTQIHLDLVGEAIWMLERNDLGVPIAIWPIPPHWMKELPRRDHPYYRLRLGNHDVDVPLTEVIAFFESNPADPYGRGSGIAKALGDELETDEYAGKYLKNFFYNDARPDLIVSADNLRKEETDRLEEKWLNKHQGFWNSFKPHFLNRKVDVKEIGHGLDDLQMQQLRKHERDTIIQVFGAPPEKFGILQASNRSTIAASDVFWQRDVIMPRAEHIRSVLQRKLVPMFDENLILDFESPVVEDAEHELQVMNGNPRAFTINEWRRAANHGSLGDEGEAYVQPGHFQVVPSDDEPLPQAATLVDSGGGGGGQQQQQFYDGASRKQDGDFVTQSIAGRKSKWSSRQAFIDWAKDHGYKTGKVDDTENFWRLRQKNPDDFSSLKTICINPNDESPGSSNCKVQAVGGPKKSAQREALKASVEQALRKRLQDHVHAGGNDSD